MCVGSWMVRPHMYGCVCPGAIHHSAHCSIGMAVLGSNISKCRFAVGGEIRAPRLCPGRTHPVCTGLQLCFQAAGQIACRQRHMACIIMPLDFVCMMVN